MEKWLEIGLSGWLIFGFTVLVGGGLVSRRLRRRSRQSNIKAGGDVAGGDIVRGDKTLDNNIGCSSSNSVQKNITADGDVAGGDIFKTEK